MTEFITRCCRVENRYEVIIKTDSEEHYRATQDFARRPIDHAKPMTNADRIRAMSDKELAELLDGAQYRQWEAMQENEDEMREYRSCVEGWKIWLQQPAEEETT